MIADTRQAVWVSHSSISDYLQCPRLYYLRNVWRDPRNNHKVNVVSPPLALGQAVHEVIESLSLLPVEERLRKSLLDEFEKAWRKISGEKGGFANLDEEARYKARGMGMIQKVIDHPGPVGKKATKIRETLPRMILSEEDNIILCGKIDWLEYDEEKNAIYIVDFKTGKQDEDPSSLQLPIYYILVKSCQARPVIGVRYWYLDRDEAPQDMPLPDEEEGKKRILDIAKAIVLARKLERFSCKYKDGCRGCRPFEAVVSGKGKFVGESEFHQDIYILPSPHNEIQLKTQLRRSDDLPF